MTEPERASIVGLRRIRLLEGLSDAELERVASLCSWKVHKPNPTFPIVSRDADDTDVYFLVSGRMKVAVHAENPGADPEGRSRRDRDVIFRELRAGDSFGELAAIDGARRSADIYVVEESLVYRLTAKAFMQLVDESAILRRNLLRMLVSTVRDLSERLLLSTKAVQERLRAFILQLVKETGAEGNTVRLDPIPTHSEIASWIGTSREEVTRGLRQMKDDGLVALVDVHAIIVLDVARLRELVQYPSLGRGRPPRAA